MALFKKIFPLLLLLGLMLPAFSFLLHRGEYWNMHDDMQLVRQLEMEKCLNDGQIPCRWVPDLGYGYGYPLFNFYPPLPYYIGEVFRSLSLSFVTTVKLTAVAQFLFSGIGMYLLAADIFTPLGGLVAALFYTYAPYHAVNVYVRGAMNEAWAAALFPLIFYFSKKFLEKSDYRYLLLYSLSFSALFLAHNPMVLIFTPVLLVWLTFWFFTYSRHRQFFKNILVLGLASVLGLGLSAYFTLPVLFESKLVQIETMFENYYYYSQHFVSFSQLFLSNFWGDGPSVWGPNDGMPYALGYLHWLVPLSVSILILWQFLRRRSGSRESRVTLIIVAMAFVVTFMSHERSALIWRLLPSIQKIQFPWRFLNLSAFLFSLASGSVVLFFSGLKSHFKIYFSALLITLLLILNIPHFTPVTHGPVTDAQKFSGIAWRNQVTGGIYDYLPKTAPTAPKTPAQDYLDAVEPPSVVYSVSGAKKGSDWQFFNLDLKAPAVVDLATLYFPGFKLKVDGQPQAITSDPTLGRISFPLAAGNHQLYLKLFNTPVRTAANLLSLTSWAVYLLLVLIVWKKPKLLP